MNRFELGTLRAYYGALLTEKQNEMLRLHYDADISFGEIAEMYNVSRQAVLDSIRRGENALMEYESKLMIVQRENEILNLLDNAQKALESADEKACFENMAQAKRLLEE